MCVHYVWHWQCCGIEQSVGPPSQCMEYLERIRLYKQKQIAGIMSPRPEYCEPKDWLHRTWIRFWPTEFRPCPNGHNAVIPIPPRQPPPPPQQPRSGSDAPPVDDRSRRRGGLWSAPTAPGQET
ncbi:hypothetical protein MBLNU457_g2578t1 [Dothideomycetes sp. NU457]